MRRERDLVRSNFVEQELGGVGDFDDAGEIEEPGDALDGVEGAKYDIDQLVVGGIRLEREDGVLGVGEVLTGFEGEVADIFVGVLEVHRDALVLGN